MKIEDEFSGTLTLTENSTKELFRVLKEQDETFISDVLDGKYGFDLKSADGRGVKLIPADRPKHYCAKCKYEPIDKRCMPCSSCTNNPKNRDAFVSCEVEKKRADDERDS